jgi:hypothetical protein
MLAGISIAILVWGFLTDFNLLSPTRHKDQDHQF